MQPFGSDLGLDSNNTIVSHVRTSRFQPRQRQSKPGSNSVLGSGVENVFGLVLTVRTSRSSGRVKRKRS